MKEQELRFGNLVIFDEREFKITSGQLIDYADQYLPIELTPEWLERMVRIPWLSNDIDGYFFWFNGEKKYIKFLHTLQNVYFSIETKELECVDTKRVST